MDKEFYGRYTKLGQEIITDRPKYVKSLIKNGVNRFDSGELFRVIGSPYRVTLYDPVLIEIEYLKTRTTITAPYCDVLYNLVDGITQKKLDILYG